MLYRLTFLSLLFASGFVHAASTPRIQLFSDDRETLTFFQSVEKAIAASGGLTACYERTFNAGEIERRQYRFFGLILPSGELSLERDFERKAGGYGWDKLPEAYRQNDACVLKVLKRVRLPHPTAPVQLEIRLSY